MGIEFLHPWWLLLLLPVAFAIYWWHKEEQRLVGIRKNAVAVLRSGLFLLLILAVVGTSLKAPVRDQQTVFVVDESKSISNPAQAVAWIEQAVKHKGPQDGLSILGFGERAAVEYPLMHEALGIELGSVQNPNYTNLSSGLRLAQGLLHANYKPRVVLLSDGEQNLGDAEKEAAYLHERGVRVDVVKLPQETGAEVLLQSASVPTTLYQGENFAMTVSVQSTVSTTAELRIYEDNQQRAAVSIQVAKGDSRFTVPLAADKPGFHSYRAEIHPLQDTAAANNTVYAYGEVSGRPSVLLVEGKSGEAKWLMQALQAGQVPFETRLPQTMPSNLEDLRRYAAIVLANVSGTELPDQIQKQIEIAVKDFGVGLLMTGGEDSFGLGGYFGSPVEKALPVYMDLRNQRETPSLGLMLVVDRSGSMATEKMELAKEAARRSARMLTPQDTLGVVAFDTTPWWVIEPAKVTDTKALENKISGINAGGGTDIYPALADAFDRLQKVQAKRKHIILLTDGQSAPGDYETLTSQMREKGITMSTVAVGTDADQALLRSLAEKAKGRFYEATNAGNVPQIFSKETALAGKTFIEDSPFTPVIGRTGELGPLFARGLPQINAVIATTPKETADVALAHPDGLPLLARWQYGLGRAAAWTSDAKGVWSNQWAAWEGSGAFWNQLLTWLLPQYRTNNLEIRPSIAAGQGQAEVRLKQPVPEGTMLQAEIINPDLTRQEVALSLQAPGVYSAGYRADKPGTYMITVKEERSGQAIASATTGVAVSYSPEHALPKNGDELLQRIAKAGGGQVLAEPGDAFADNLQAKWNKRDISLLLLLLAACMWPLDVALRRVSLPWHRIKVWIRSAARAVFQGTAAGGQPTGFGGHTAGRTGSAALDSIGGLKARAKRASQRGVQYGATTETAAAGGIGRQPSQGASNSNVPHSGKSSTPHSGKSSTPPVGEPSAQTGKPPRDETTTVSRLLDKKRKK